MNQFVIVSLVIYVLSDVCNSLRQLNIFFLMV